MKQLNILQFGRSGQVGLELIKSAGVKSVALTALGRDDVDLRDPESISDAIRSADPRPSLVINAAAYTAVDAAETDEDTAHAVNCIAPRIMAETCAELGIGLIHLSTDYVFDGSQTRPYSEDDPVQPLGVYGRTKQAGEVAVLKAHPSACILRTSWVFSPHGKNFLKTMLFLAANRDDVSIVDDQRGCPTSASDIAAAILDLADLMSDDPSRTKGLFHFTGREEISWYGFAQVIFEKLESRGLKRPVVNPITTDQYPTPAGRPQYSVLNCSRIEASLGRQVPSWRDAIDYCLDELIEKE